MKIVALLFSGLILINLSLYSQDIVLAGWTFPGSSALADTGLVMNLENEIITLGGTSEIEFKNGFETKAAQASEWNDGMDIKAWVVYLSTVGYDNLTLSSLQSSGGNDPGPKDFKIQYSVDEGLSWMNIENGEISVENDWETGVLDNLPLPENCFDQNQLQIRWLMASNEASGNGGNVLESGKSKIDEIYIRGVKISAIVEFHSNVQLDIFPNPANNYVDIQSESIIQSIIISEITGKILLQKEACAFTERIDISGLSKGTYFITIKYKESQNLSCHKLVIN